MKYDSNIEGLLAVDVDTGSNRENLLALQDSLQTSPTSIELLNHWKQLDSHDREYLWPKLLIKVARESPHRLLKLLGGTWVAPYPPRQLVSDAIDYIIFYYLDNLQPSEESHTTAVSLYKAIKGLLLQGPLDYVQLSRHSIYILTRHLAKQQYVADCYHFLNQIGNPLTVHTLSHFVADLIVEPRYGNLAYDIFTRIGNMNPDFNFQSLQSLCTTVLLHSSSEMQVSHSEKFEYMLKCGLKPNIITYNVLLLKLLKAGDTEASWEIFQMMKENGPEPDVYTMSTLLNDAKLRRDTTSVSEILKYANDKGLRSVHITNDALHMTTLLMERARSHEVKRAAAAGEHPRPQKRTSFEVMLPYYCKHFNFKPLAHLLPGLSTTYPELIDQGALSPENIDSVETIDAERLRKVDPDNASLVIMITALLKDYHDPDTPKWFYEHFKNLIQARDPLVTRLASANNGSYAALLYNSILMALGRHASNIPLCLQILGEMSAPKTSLDSLQGESLKHSSINEPSLVPKPTSYTWGIFTDMFMEHRQPRAAEKVISMMRERGIQPTKMNWAVLLKGYAKLQDTRAVVDTLDRSERGGFPPDRVTWKLLRGIVDKRAVDEGWRASRLLRMKEEVDRLDGHTQQGVSEETIVPLHEMDVKKYGIGDMDVREPMT
jgi:pentatricopeptide repeat protein